jgi:hypothetical protein
MTCSYPNELIKNKIEYEFDEFKNLDEWTEKLALSHLDSSICEYKLYFK